MLIRRIINMEELDILINAVKEGENDQAVKQAQMIINKIEPKKIMYSLTQCMRELGDRFEKKEIFLPELLVASDALLEVMEVVKPYLVGDKVEKKKTIIIGTVAGDIHEIGKNMVSMVLRAEGFNVIDLGTDVSVRQFIHKAEEVDADVIGLSTLMTTTMKVQQDVIEQLKVKNKRNKYLVIVGGAPTSKKWADKIGADAYCENAFTCVKYLNSLS
jgi:corrinoid protein of di/trimethylamine methyltransferase